MADLRVVHSPDRGPYDHLAAQYDRLYVSRAARAEDFVVTRDLRRLARGARVLDVACGTGYVMDQVRDLVTNYIGTDISHPMIDIASAKHPGAGFYVEDMSYPVRRISKVDLATCLWALNYAGDTAKARRAVTEMWQDLQLGGKVYAVVYTGRRPTRKGYPAVEGNPIYWDVQALQRRVFFQFQDVKVRGLSSRYLDRLQWLPQWLSSHAAALQSH